MGRLNTKPMRVDPIVELKYRDLAIQRVKNGVDTKIRVPSEMMRMQLNCPSMPKVFQELTTIPRKEDLKKR